MADRLPTRSDCGRCAALCCIAYPSQEMPGFAAAKEAGEPCPKLDRCGACTIYERRAQAGFAGCIDYECFGAGQHVVQRLFEGRDWRDDPALLEPMLAAFLAMRQVSDLLFLVEKARRLHRSRDELELIGTELEAIASSRSTLTDTRRIAAARAALERIYAGLDRELFEIT